MSERNGRVSAAEDRTALRQALGCFLTGVTVVTTVDELGRPRGIAANSFTSVSLDPPLVLVCIAKGAASYDAFVAGRGFGVSILNESQRHVAAKFASKDPDKFEHVQWSLGQGGAPILSDSLSWLDCCSEERIEVGDHVILIGRVLDYGYQAERPLGYFKGGFVDFGLEQAALDHVQNHSLVLGCIVEHREHLLLCRKSADHPWTLPFSDLLDPKGSQKRALKKLLQSLGVDIELTFLFSVFDMAESNAVCVTYRANAIDVTSVAEDAPLQSRLFQVGELPWPDIVKGPVTNMLRRYIKERSSEQFGIYAEYEGGGQLAELRGKPQPWRRPKPNSLS